MPVLVALDSTMTFITRSSIPAFFICLFAVSGASRTVAAQTSWSVSTAGDLTAALAGAFNNNVSNPSLLNTITLTGNISGSSQWIVNANVSIVGNGYTINMNNADRAFFIAGGTGSTGPQAGGGGGMGGNGGNATQANGIQGGGGGGFGNGANGGNNNNGS